MIAIKARVYIRDIPANGINERALSFVDVEYGNVMAEPINGAKQGPSA